MNTEQVSTMRTTKLRDSGDAFFEGVHDMLLSFENTVEPIGSHAQVILDKLSERLFSMREKGFSFDEIACLLRRCDVNIASETIKGYFETAQAKRLLVCEKKIADYYKLKWNEVVARTEFIEHGLNRVLKDGRGLILYYQPQVDMLTGEVLGAEALIRWEYEGKLIQPAGFISVAERTGLIADIGEWVLREACREAKRWQLMGLGGGRGLKMSVNLSVKQLSSELPDLVHGILCDTGLPTSLLGLEITESFLLEEGSLPVLQTLRDSGIHLSIDDFGTGYSCLAQLKDLPLDTIKIDRAFVTDLPTGGNSAAVVESIIDLARKLNMRTLAEGVETMEQSQALIKLGCTECQGFLHSKPVPADDFIQYDIGTGSM